MHLGRSTTNLQLRILISLVAPVIRSGMTTGRLTSRPMAHTSSKVRLSGTAVATTSRATGLLLRPRLPTSAVRTVPYLKMLTPVLMAEASVAPLLVAMADRHRLTLNSQAMEGSTRLPVRTRSRTPFLVRNTSSIMVKVEDTARGELRMTQEGADPSFPHKTDASRLLPPTASRVSLLLPDDGRQSRLFSARRKCPVL